MNDDELKAIWKASNERKQNINLNSINMSVMNQAMKQFENRITARNNREIGAAIFIIVVLSVEVYDCPNLLSRLGLILLILYALGVIYFIRKPKEKQPRFDLTQSIKKQLVDYQEYVRVEQKLLRNVLYWYILPVVPGVILFILGLEISILRKIIHFGIMALIWILIYFLNQRAARENMNPLLADIAKTLKSLEETNS